MIIVISVNAGLDIVTSAHLAPQEDVQKSGKLLVCLFKPILAGLVFEVLLVLTSNIALQRQNNAFEWYSKHIKAYIDGEISSGEISKVSVLI